MSYWTKESMDPTNQASIKKSIERRYECVLPDGVVILWHGYDDDYNCGYGEDEGYIFELGGQLFFQTATHCSCYGFEGCWAPEPEEIERLTMIPDEPELCAWARERILAK